MARAKVEATCAALLAYVLQNVPISSEPDTVDGVGEEQYDASYTFAVTEWDVAAFIGDLGGGQRRW